MNIRIAADYPRLQSGASWQHHVKGASMGEPKGPLEISGESEIYVCRCMQSEYWPYCDSSHHGKGGGGPERVALDKNKTYLLCRCFRSKSAPFCDGSHKAAGL